MQPPSSKRLLLLIATFWVGSLWTVGYVVAPTLFATLADRSLAGTIAGALFRVEAWISLACALAILMLITVQRGSANRQRTVLLRIVIAMSACTLLGYFGLQPLMAALREAGSAGGGMTADARLHFGLLHGVAAVVFFAQSVLGVVLMLKLNFESKH